MIVLHAAFSDGSLLLRGESPGAENASLAHIHRQRQPSAAERPWLHYDAAQGRLLEALAGILDLRRWLGEPSEEEQRGEK